MKIFCMKEMIPVTKISREKDLAHASVYILSYSVGHGVGKMRIFSRNPKKNKLFGHILFPVSSGQGQDG